ncbi:MAG TPA: VOC family protein [Actinospica sp.]|nr:VOC family protein [Actinospica sp.]
MISHIRQVSLGVPELRRSRDFYENHWGLEAVASDADLVYFGSGCSESYVLRLRAAEQPRVDLLAFAVESPAEVDRIAGRAARQSGGKLLGEPFHRQEPGAGYAARFLDCDGRTVEVSSGVTQRSHTPAAAADSRPLSISHVVLNTVDIQRSRAYYEAVLGLRVSDWVEDFFCFLRCGPAHHVLAFTSGPYASLNHVAFEVRGVDEFMRATGAMMRKGHSPIWGPGRHGVGDNTFSYFAEPSSGFVTEYTTALQVVDDSWCPQVHRATDQGTDQWGTSNALDEVVRTALRGVPDPGLWTPPPV